jgi:hypothetical protein
MAAAWSAGWIDYNSSVVIFDGDGVIEGGIASASALSAS